MLGLSADAHGAYFEQAEGYRVGAAHYRQSAFEVIEGLSAAHVPAFFCLPRFGDAGCMISFDTLSKEWCKVGGSRNL